jgi:GntR family transcriptional regulator
MALDIDRTSPEAYYLQLSHHLEQQIVSGVYPVGSRLGGETELCRSYGLSRATVREALRSLQDRGLIKIISRRGAFVADPRPSGWTLQSAAGFFEDEVGRHHRLVETTVLRSEIAPLPKDASKALQLPSGAAGVILERSRKLDGRPALYGINYSRAELAPVIRASEIERGNGSLNEVLRRAGYPVTGAFRSLESVGADSKLAKLLDVKVGAPLMLIHSTSWNGSLTPFDYYTSWVRTDVVKIEINVAAIT